MSGLEWMTKRSSIAVFANISYSSSMKSKMEKVMGNPQASYADPQEVVCDRELSREEKIEVLENWKAEAVHVQESTAEGFDGGEPSQLDKVIKALHEVER